MDEPNETVRDARQGIQSVEIAGRVLRALELNRGPMTLSQLAAATEMGASKMHRYLVSLSRVGLVSQSRSSGVYDMGMALRSLGVEALRRTEEVNVASEFGPELRDRTGHSINLAVWSEHGPVIVRWEYGSYPLPITVRVGATMPLVTSSHGLVFLAHLPSVATRRLLMEEVSGGGGARDRRLELDELLEKVRGDGYAVTSGNIIPGVTTVAAPVFSAGDSMPLSIAVAMPARSADDSEMARVVEELRKTSTAISRALGIG